MPGFFALPKMPPASMPYPKIPQPSRFLVCHPQPEPYLQQIVRNMLDVFDQSIAVHWLYAERVQDH
jgi:hypothetical protein